jgi:hypothetical protein
MRGKYIYELRGWPRLIWDREQLVERLGAVRRQAGASYRPYGGAGISPAAGGRAGDADVGRTQKQRDRRRAIGCGASALVHCAATGHGYRRVETGGSECGRRRRDDVGRYSAILRTPDAGSKLHLVADSILARSITAKAIWFKRSAIRCRCLSQGFPLRLQLVGTHRNFGKSAEAG